MKKKKDIAALFVWLLGEENNKILLKEWEERIRKIVEANKVK